MSAYYNENNREAAAWLRELIKAKVIAPGHVDERDIRDVQPRDLDGFVQCHFFAGIGVWSYALRLAGWPDEAPVWTGSCPCQPFSAAGQGNGFADERHLWPSWFYLIEEHRPGVVFGEQVASPDGLVWLELVQADMEGTDYAFGPKDICAAGFGAPHIRQRSWFVGDSGRERSRRNTRAVPCEEGTRSSEWLATRDLAHEPVTTGNARGLAHTDGRHARAEREQPGGEQRLLAQDGSPVRSGDPRARPLSTEQLERSGAVHSFWRDSDWVFCRDNKWRPVEPGAFPLAHGAPARLGRLRGYGNAIVAEAAAAFIGAYLETRQVG